MEEHRIIIDCPYCAQKIRIPSGKHIRFSCPKCSVEFEFKDGVRVTTPVNNEPPPTRKRKDSKKYSLLLLFSIIISGWLIYLYVREEPPPSLSDKIEEVKFPGSTIVRHVDTISGTPAHFDFTIPNKRDPVDSLLAEELKDLLLDLSIDLLEKFCESLIEEAEHGHWIAANDWYERSVTAIEQLGTKGLNFLERHQSIFATTKNKILSYNPDNNELPPSRPGTIIGPATKIAYESVDNSTGYTLTLYYSGPVSKIVKIQPNSLLLVPLPMGTYTIVAKVNEKRIGECFSTRSFDGFRYSIRYTVVEIYVPARTPGFRLR